MLLKSQKGKKKAFHLLQTIKSGGPELVETLRKVVAGANPQTLYRTNTFSNLGILKTINLQPRSLHCVLAGTELLRLPILSSLALGDRMEVPYFPALS